ncbi:MAG: hypothetical protein H7263_17615 [Candidatus Sericytochromatia bacterium]|nr:hypothetical protein [Candidatus Sericytochromatia bacterium]
MSTINSSNVPSNSPYGNLSTQAFKNQTFSLTKPENNSLLSSLSLNLDNTFSAPSLKSGNAPTELKFDLSTSPLIANNPATKVNTPSVQNTKNMDSIVSELSKLKNNPTAFAAKVNEILKNPAERSSLISHYGLNSPENKKDLGIAMFLEAGEGLKTENMMPVGAVILNRAISTNLALEASGKKQHVSIAEVIKERNQFAIKGSFNSALSGGRKDAVHYGTSTGVKNMVDNLCDGKVGNHPQAANAFFFQRGRLGHTSFRAGLHNFSQTPSKAQYINGNYLINHNGNHYHK